MILCLSKDKKVKVFWLYKTLWVSNVEDNPLFRQCSVFFKEYEGRSLEEHLKKISAYGTNQSGWERSNNHGKYLKFLAPTCDQNGFSLEVSLLL